MYLIQEENRFIIHNGMWHLFSSYSKKATKRIIRILHLTVQKKVDGITYFNEKITDCSFTSKKQLPLIKRKIKLLSNGSIVTGYVRVKDKVITIYRPNPNCKDIYKPLSLEKHIAYQKKYGIF